MNKKKTKLKTLDQWVEIEVRDGVTVTTKYPSNAEMNRLMEKMDTKPDLVYRRLFFVHGVPDEYRAVTEDPQQLKYGGCCLFRMSLERWYDTVEKEQQLGREVALLLGMTLPRPEERGGCDCPACTGSRKFLEARGIECL